MKGCLKWVGIAVLIVVAVPVIIDLIVGTGEGATAEDGSTDSGNSTSERPKEPDQQPNEFTLATDPPSVPVSLQWSGERAVETTPFTIDIPHGVTVQYGIRENLNKWLRSASGTFTAPNAGETVSIWIDRYSESEVQEIRAEREAARVARERAAEAERRARELERVRDRLDDARAEVLITCEDLVKRSLKAPSTAKFGNIWNGRSSYRVSPSSGTSVYTATVDAQNGFGAMIRNTFSCTYDLDSNVVRLVSLE
jgi:hypothetical protein